MNLRKRTIYSDCFTLAVLLLLNACSGTSNTTTQDPNNEPLSKVAVIFAEDDSPGPVGGSPYLSLFAGELIEPKSVDQVMSTTLASYKQTQGACSSLAGLDINANDPFGLGEAKELNAGDVITVVNDGNSYADLVIANSEYSWQASESGVLPENLVMNIPGNEFPAIENIIIPYLSDIDVVQQENYEAGSILTWQASNESELPLWISLNNGDQICFEEDDGSFQLPDIAAEIRGISIIKRLVSVSRYGDVMVVIVRTKTWGN